MILKMWSAYFLWWCLYGYKYCIYRQHTITRLLTQACDTWPQCRLHWTQQKFWVKASNSAHSRFPDFSSMIYMYYCTFYSQTFYPRAVKSFNPENKPMYLIFWDIFTVFLCSDVIRSCQSESEKCVFLCNLKTT